MPLQFCNMPHLTGGYTKLQAVISVIRLLLHSRSIDVKIKQFQHLAVQVARAAVVAATDRHLPQAALAHRAAQMRAPAARAGRAVTGVRREPVVALAQMAITAVELRAPRAVRQAAQCACSQVA